MKRSKNMEPDTTPLSNKTLTIPNLLSFFRIILITPFVVFFLNKDYLAATITIAVSGITDVVDGFIARKFHQESQLGKILDPLGDKLTLIAAGICLVFIEPYVIPLMVIMVIKDLLMLICGSYIIRHGIIPPKSKWYGKLGTVMFYVSVGLIILMEILNYENKLLSIVLLTATAAVMLFSLVNYAGMFLEFNRQIKENEQRALEAERQKMIRKTVRQR